MKKCPKRQKATPISCIRSVCVLKFSNLSIASKTYFHRKMMINCWSLRSTIEKFGTKIRYTGEKGGDTSMILWVGLAKYSVKSRYRSVPTESPVTGTWLSNSFQKLPKNGKKPANRDIAEKAEYRQKAVTNDQAVKNAWLVRSPCYQFSTKLLPKQGLWWPTFDFWSIEI